MIDKENDGCLTCKNCGWVHFPVTRKEAIEQIDSFNNYYNNLSEEKQQDYYGGRSASMESYDRCSRCGGNYRNFRISTADDCPAGCTIGPILYFNEPEDVVNE